MKIEITLLAVLLKWISKRKEFHWIWLNREENKSFLFVGRKNSEAKLGPILLEVKFKIRKANIYQRKILPRLSIPFFAGFPGFVNKTYSYDEKTKTMAGLYHWESKEEAETYLRSFPGIFMRWNAHKGVINHRLEELK